MREATPAHLYEEYELRIYRYCLGRLWSTDEAEDAAQATLLQAFHELERGVLPRFVSPWLFRIADDVCRSRRLSALERLGVPVEAALGELPREQRDLLELREVRRLSYREIAGRLGCTLRDTERKLLEARQGLVENARRAARALDLGSIAAGAKSTLGGGAAVKAGAAAVAVAVGTAGGLRLAEPDPQSAAPSQPSRAPSARAHETTAPARATPLRRAAAAAVPRRKQARVVHPRRKVPPVIPAPAPPAPLPATPPADPAAPRPAVETAPPAEVIPAAAPEPVAPPPAAPAPAPSVEAPPPPTLEAPVPEAALPQLPPAPALPPLPDAPELPSPPLPSAPLP